MAAQKKKPTKSSSAPTKKKSYKRYVMYTVSGDQVQRKNKPCPKCGVSSYLAEHKDRLQCGKCGYAEKK